MDALKYIKEKIRMCESNNCCEDCILSISNNGTKFDCDAFECNFPEKTIKIVEDWSKEHPSKLEEKFKNAAENGIDELDLFLELIKEGYTLEAIKKQAPGRYEYAKAYMEEHGLI